MILVYYFKEHIDSRFFQLLFSQCELLYQVEIETLALPEMLILNAFAPSCIILDKLSYKVEKIFFLEP